MEQIELDLVHNFLDQQAKNGSQEYFADDNYENYDKDTDEVDQLISDHSVPVHKKGEKPPNPKPAPEPAPQPAAAYREEDWEDVDD